MAEVFINLEGECQGEVGNGALPKDFPGGFLFNEMRRGTSTRSSRTTNTISRACLTRTRCLWGTRSPMIGYVPCAGWVWASCSQGSFSHWIFWPWWSSLLPEFTFASSTCVRGWRFIDRRLRSHCGRLHGLLLTKEHGPWTIIQSKMYLWESCLSVWTEFK